MVRLQADAQHAAFAHGVAAACDHADLRRCQHQIFVAHDFGDRRSHLRSNGPVQPPKFGFSGFIAKNEFPELAHGHAFDGRKGLSIMSFENQAAYIVLVGINDGIRENLSQSMISQGAFGGHPFLFGARCDACQLVAGFLFVGFGQQFA